MSFLICCVPGCMTRSGKGVSLHAFPDPAKEMNRFRTWVQNVGGDIVYLDEKFVFHNRRVCHLHFEKKYHYDKQRLSKAAIPILNIPGRCTAAYKTLMINNITSSHSVGANCEKDEGSCLQNLTYFFEDTTNTADNSSVSINEHSWREEHLNITLIDTEKLIYSSKTSDVEKCAAIGYCSGWLIKLAKKWVYKGCTICKSECESTSMCDFHNFIKVSEYSDKGWLMYPTRQMFNLFAQIENIVYEILKTDCLISNISEYIKLIITLHLDFNFLTCNIHKEKLAKYIVSKNVIFCLHNWSKEVNQILAGKSNCIDETDSIKSLAFNHYLKNKTRKRTRQTGIALGM